MYRPTSLLIPLALLSSTYAAAFPAPQESIPLEGLSTTISLPSWDDTTAAANVVIVTLTSGVTTTTKSVTHFTVAPYVPPATETVTDGVKTTTAAVVVVPSGATTSTLAVVESQSGTATSTLAVVAVTSGTATTTIVVSPSQSGVTTSTVKATATTNADAGNTGITLGPGGTQPTDSASISSQVNSIESSLLEEMTKITSTVSASSRASTVLIGGGGGSAGASETGSFSTVFGVSKTSTLPCQATSTGGVCTKTSTSMVTVAPGGNATATAAPPAFTGAASQLKAGAAIAAGVVGAMFALF